MKNLSLRNEVYRACPGNLRYEIKKVKQFIESFNEPVTLDEEWISFICEELKKKPEKALFSLYKQPFISEKVGYIKFPKILIGESGG